MQVETFQIFCDVVETSSFSDAAKRHGISQSAVSQQIRGLEERFGVVLLERGHRRFSVTPEGEAFLTAARSILETYRGIAADFIAMRDVVAGPLTIATVYSIGFHELPEYLKRFRRRYPEVDLEVRYRRSQEVYLDVAENRADLGLVAYPHERKGLEVERAWRDRLVVICPSGHPLAKRRALEIKSLAGQRFVSFEPDLPTRKAIDALFEQAGVEVREMVEFDNIEAVKRAVIIEQAVSIVPGESVREEVANGTLVQIPFEGTFVWRPIGILRRRSRTASPAMREMIQLLQSGRSSDSPAECSS